ncbi:MAG: hypothetical protein ABFS46_08460 [Myxococcota bacterium]
MRRQPHRPFRRTRRTVERWLRAWRGPAGRTPLAELWHGTGRKTWLIPYETSWRGAAVDEPRGFDDSFGESLSPSANSSATEADAA